MTASASAATASKRNSLPPSAIKCKPAGIPLSGYKPMGKVIAQASIALAVRTKQLRCGSTGTLIPRTVTVASSMRGAANGQVGVRMASAPT